MYLDLGAHIGGSGVDRALGAHQSQHHSLNRAVLRTRAIILQEDAVLSCETQVGNWLAHAPAALGDSLVL